MAHVSSGNRVYMVDSDSYADVKTHPSHRSARTHSE